MKARIRMTRSALMVAALALALAFALAGCGSEVAGGGSAPGGSTGSESTGASVPNPIVTPTRDPGDPVDPTIAQGGTLTLVGTVSQGAEPSCLILQTAQGQFELLSAEPVPHEGDKVKVVGHVVKAMSHCMQGQPFLVEQLTIG